MSVSPGEDHPEEIKSHEREHANEGGHETVAYFHPSFRKKNNFSQIVRSDCAVLFTFFYVGSPASPSSKRGPCLTVGDPRDGGAGRGGVYLCHAWP